MAAIRCQVSGVRRHGAATCNRGSGFTLIELLVVIAIIMILMAMLFPAYNLVRQTAKKARAKSEVKQLDMAWKSVLSDYRTWALSGAPMQPKMDSASVQYLAGGNTKGIMYMEFDNAATNSAGSMVDPWYSTKNSDNIYRVALGQTKVTVNGQDLYRSVAVWSIGADAQDNTKDDVKSWE